MKLYKFVLTALTCTTGPYNRSNGHSEYFVEFYPALKIKQKKITFFFV